jgi:methionine-rich copper-binding protein CopC
MSIFIRRMMGWAGVALLLLGTTGYVAAHARYVRSEPAQNAALTTPPQRVTVYFAEQLDMDGSSLAVVDASGTTVSSGSGQRLANDPRGMWIAVRPNLGPGTYTVQWKSRSADDGDDANGSFAFSVRAGAVAAQSSPGGQSSSGGATTTNVLPDTGASTVEAYSLWLGVLGFVLVIAAWTLKTWSRRAVAPDQGSQR